MGYNKITLYGGEQGRDVDYLYIQKTNAGIDKFQAISSEPDTWSNSTLMSASFNNTLLGGNTLSEVGFNGYELRRGKGTDNHTDYVATIRNGDDDFVIDYTVVSNEPYTYYLFPIFVDGDKTYTFAPQVSSEVSTDLDYWSLLVVDETDEDNIFYLNKMFKFQLNLQVGDMQNNAEISVIKNFTRYPTIQHAPSNHWSGSLTSMTGYVSCATSEYVQKAGIINSLKELTSDTRRKFLKDMDGNIWEVDITSAINISTDETLQSVKNVSISWTEVKGASNVTIRNNPDIPLVEWVLTDYGQAMPNISYIWDDTAIWNDNEIWTDNDDESDINILNNNQI